MNLIVHDFLLNNKINKKYICTNHGGSNITPKISWTKIQNALSYAFIIEDPDTPSGSFIHWYIPYISKDIQEIDHLLLDSINNLNINKFNKHDSIKIFNGKNSLGELGYHGPCAPNKTGIHRYIFTIYALDNLLEIDKNNIEISDNKNFCNILEKAGIIILHKQSITFEYSYKNFSS